MSAVVDMLVLPEMRQRGTRSGAEWALVREDAIALVEAASSRGVAVLGVEVFQPQGDGLQAVGTTVYQHERVQWAAFVTRNNESALKFLRAQPGDLNLCYILTAATEMEFSELKKMNG